MTAFLQRLRERKLVQWALAYVASALALVQGLDIVAQRFGWPEQAMRVVIVAVAIGFFVILVLAWHPVLGSASGATASVDTLRIDLVWNPLRANARFKELLADRSKALRVRP